MSEIKTKSQNWPVHSKQDVIALYNGTRTNPNLPEKTSQIGMEVEQNFYTLETLHPLTKEQSLDIVSEGGRQAIGINNEPTATTLEVLTDPHPKANFHDLIAQINRRFLELWDLGLENGALPTPFGYLPHITPEQHHFIDNERFKAMWLSGRSDVIEARSSFLDSSIQVSVSYRDFDHLLKIMRLSVALEPFLTLTTECDAGFFEGRAMKGSPRTVILKRRGLNGGVPDFYYNVKSGEELIDAHIDFSMNNPHVFLCFDNGGVLRALPQGVWTSFSTLEEKGYGRQTLLNYRQAQSESWRRTINLAEIRDDEGTLFGHRAEISSLFCTGLQHQRATAAILSFHLAYCGHFYDSIETLLKDFGIDLQNLETAKTILDQNFEHVHNHGGRYFDLPFGTRTIKDFAISFSEIVGECFKGSGLDQFSAPLMHILETGRPDWLVNRELFKNLEQQKAYMKALPGLVQENSDLISHTSCVDWTAETIKRFLASAQ